MIDGLGFASLNLDTLLATRLSGSVICAMENRSPQSLSPYAANGRLLCTSGPEIFGLAAML